MRRSRILQALLLVLPTTLVHAQQCLDFAPTSSNATLGCDCPPGLGGKTCQDLTCGNPILSPASRSVVNSTAGRNGCNTAGGCTTGFGGVNCNVCQSAQACSAAIAAAPSSSRTTSAAIPSGTSLGSGITAGGTDNVVCNNSPYTYTEGFISCDVVNPTLQAVFAGTTYLSIQKTQNPSLSLSSAYGSNATALAQLWYSPNSSSVPIQQFYCAADSCTQKNDTSSNQVQETCSNLSCRCIPGTAFCGGSVLDLTTTINGLSGTLEVDCENGSGGNCYFKQSILQSLFGQNGLALSSCQFGECVLQSVMNALAPASAVNASNGLSGGVIAGLAVLGVIVFILACLIGIGYINQSRARKGKGAFGFGRGGTGMGLGKGPVEPVGLAWRDIRYVLPKPSKFGAISSGTEDFISRFTGKGRTSQRGAPTSISGVVPVFDKGDAEEAGELVVQGGYSDLGTGAGRWGGGKVILDGVSGSIEPGRMLAILGPSGAGKSTLVDILACRRKVGRQTGSIELVMSESSGSNTNAAAATIGYVDQSDVLPPTSTVREALMFAAELKMPEWVSKQTKVNRVDEVMHKLGLYHIAESRIGSGERRGISGGERRRLSIGLELMADPAILILDEPTSGLDSVSAMKVVQVLKKLTEASDEDQTGNRKRTTVVTTIHQPSSQIFHSFDVICVLGLGGRQIYYGPAEAAVDRFARQGLVCPAGYNPADYLLEIASSTSDRQSEHSGAGHEPISPGLFASGAEQSMAASVQQRRGYVTVNGGEEKVPLGNPTFPPTPRAPLTSSRMTGQSTGPVTTMLTQFEVLAGREYRNLKRDWSLVVMHNLVAGIVGVFVGGLFFQINTTISGFQNRVGSLFCLSLLLAFSALSALSNLVTIRSLFLRERANAYYSPISWLFSRVVFDIVPLRICPTIIVSTIVYWMVGLTPAAANFFKYLLILLEYNVAVTLFNLFLAVSFREGGVAILISSILNLYQMAYAGFFLSLSSIPPVLRWLQWLDPLRYSLEALAVNEVTGGLLISDTLQGVHVQISAALIMELLFGFQQDAYYRNVLVLFGWIGLFGIALILTIVYRLHEVR